MKPYHRNDNKLHAHDKFQAAGFPAVGLWTMCRSWAADNWTDGFIPSYIVKRFVSERGVRVGQYAARLVEVGLWEEVEGGWQFHDWADWNTTVAERDAANAAAAERMRVSRAKRSAASSQPVRSEVAASSQPVRSEVTPEPAGQDELFARTPEQEVRTRIRTRGTTSLVARDATDGIIDRWRQHYEGRPPDGVRNRLRKEINKLLGQGYPADLVERAVVEWHRTGWHPATLESVYDRLQRGPATWGNTRSTTNDRVMTALQLAEKYDAATARGEIEA